MLLNSLNNRNHYIYFEIYPIIKYKIDIIAFEKLPELTIHDNNIESTFFLVNTFPK